MDFRTHRHVQLFRQLQARWQCFDAYARVCMSFGVRHMLQSINYYLLGLCMVQLYVPYMVYVSFALTLIFQALAVNITILDIHGLPCFGTFDLAFIGFLPALIACVALSMADRDEDVLREENSYPFSVAIYPLEPCKTFKGKRMNKMKHVDFKRSLKSLKEILWFELFHWVASPSTLESSVPRHFRAVLFMDVFGDADDPITGSASLGAEPMEVLNEAKDIEDL